MDGQSGTITSFDEALGRYEVVLDRYITIDDVIIEVVKLKATNVVVEDATQPLRAAMELHDVAGLRAALAVAEGEAGADEAIIEVSGAYDRVKTLYI